MRGVFGYKRATYPEVNTFADLPSAASNSGKIYVVLISTGTWPLRKGAGLYLSNGLTWTRLGGLKDYVIPTNPPTGYCKVTNFYVNPQNHKLIVEYDDIPIP